MAEVKSANTTTLNDELEDDSKSTSGESSSVNKKTIENTDKTAEEENFGKNNSPSVVKIRTDKILPKTVDSTVQKIANTSVNNNSKPENSSTEKPKIKRTYGNRKSHIVQSESSPELSSNINTSRYGRARKPKITEDYYNIEDIFCPYEKITSSPKRKSHKLELSPSTLKNKDTNLTTALNIDIPDDNTDVSKVMKLVSSNKTDFSPKSPTFNSKNIKTYGNKKKILESHEYKCVNGVKVERKEIRIDNDFLESCRFFSDESFNSDSSFNESPLKSYGSRKSYSELDLDKQDRAIVEDEKREKLLSLSSKLTTPVENNEKINKDKNILELDLSSNVTSLEEKNKKINKDKTKVSNASSKDSGSPEKINKDKTEISNLSSKKSVYLEKKNKEIDKKKDDSDISPENFAIPVAPKTDKTQDVLNITDNVSRRLRSSISEKSVSSSVDLREVQDKVSVKTTEEAKINKVKIEETKINKVKIEEAKINKVKSEEAKINKVKSEEAKINKVKNEEAKINKVKNEEAKNNKVKIEETVEAESEHTDVKPKDDSNEDPRPYMPNVGDLAWSRVGTYPFWPSVVSNEPGSTRHTRLIMFGRKNVRFFHVHFFGDNGRRSWVLATHIFPFQRRSDLEIMAQSVSKDCKPKDPKHLSAFIINPNKLQKWETAVTEAESITNFSPEARIEKFFEMVNNPKKKSYKLNNKKNKLEKKTLKKLKKKKNLLKKLTLKSKTGAKTDVKSKEDLIKSPSPSLKREQLDDKTPETSYRNLRSKVDSERNSKKLPTVIEDSDDSLSDLDDISIKEENRSTPSPPTQISSVQRHKKINLFRGLTKERVCPICGKNKDVIKCKGNCFGFYHIECDRKIKIKVMKRLNDEKSSISSEDDDVGESLKKCLKDKFSTLCYKNNRIEDENVDSSKGKNDKSDFKFEKKDNSNKIDLTETVVEESNNTAKESDKESNLDKISPRNSPIDSESTIKNDFCEIKDNNDSNDVKHNQVSEILEEILGNVFNKVNYSKSELEECTSVSEKTNIKLSQNLSIAEQIDLKMAEVMQNLIHETKYTDSTTDDESVNEENESIKIEKPDDDKQNLEEFSHLPYFESTEEDVKTEEDKPKIKKIIKHVTADGLFDVIEEEQQIINEEFKCTYCYTGVTPPCFVCNKEIAKSGDDKKHRCAISQCGKYYHEECLKDWPQTKWNVNVKGKQTDNETLSCPYHNCHTCISDNPRGPLGRFVNERLAKCIRCPTTYHPTNFCIPAGTEILSTNQIICPKHLQPPEEDDVSSVSSSPSSRRSVDSRKSETKKLSKTKIMPHVNASWCFICSMGGDLICCETCPGAFHAECLKLVMPEGKYICEECESGRLPLYDEIVWVKLGSYRWWPAQILFPAEIPPNVASISHANGEFVVRFFGSHDHYWVNRGRVFLFQEGDSGHASGKKNSVDDLFVKAIQEATRAHKIFIDERANRAAEALHGMKPPHYIKIKVNRPIGNVRINDADTSNTNPCDCDPNWEKPCGPDSDCLNRILMTECNPLVCAAGSRCHNQNFEKRLYQPIVPFKTLSRGWGLKTLAPIKKGTFIIEYVGEVIDEMEYKRRLKRKHELKDENYYFLTIDKDRMIDAGPKGNVARFMNHSCSPNCETQKWTVNGDTRVGLFAITNISTGAELTFNYNLECVGEEKKECRCGAPNCSGFIGVKAKQDEVPKKRKSVPLKQKKKKSLAASEIKSMEVISCFVCKEPDAIQPCDREACNKYYHLNCVNLENFEAKWLCPWHSCNICTKRTTRCCYMCINSFCPLHSEGNIRYDRIKGFVCTAHDMKEEKEESDIAEDAKSKELSKIKKNKKQSRLSTDSKTTEEISENQDDVASQNKEDIQNIEESKSKTDSRSSSRISSKISIEIKENITDSSDNNDENSEMKNKQSEETNEVKKEYNEIKNEKEEQKNKNEMTLQNGALMNITSKLVETSSSSDEIIQIDILVSANKPNNTINTVRKRKSRLSLKKIGESSNSDSNSSQDLCDDEKPLMKRKKTEVKEKESNIPSDESDDNIPLNERFKIKKEELNKPKDDENKLSESSSKLSETKKPKRKMSSDSESSIKSEPDVTPKNVVGTRSTKKFKPSHDDSSNSGAKILRSSALHNSVQKDDETNKFVKKETPRIKKQKEQISVKNKSSINIERDEQNKNTQKLKDNSSKNVKKRNIKDDEETKISIKSDKSESKEMIKVTLNVLKADKIHETPEKDNLDSSQESLKSNSPNKKSAKKKFNLSLRKTDSESTTPNKINPNSRDVTSTPKPRIRRSIRNLKPAEIVTISDSENDNISTYSSSDESSIVDSSVDSDELELPQEKRKNIYALKKEIKGLEFEGKSGMNQLTRNLRKKNDNLQKGSDGVGENKRSKQDNKKVIEIDLTETDKNSSKSKEIKQLDTPITLKKKEFRVGIRKSLRTQIVDNNQNKNDKMEESQKLEKDEETSDKQKVKVEDETPKLTEEKSSNKDLGKEIEEAGTSKGNSQTDSVKRKRGRPRKYHHLYETPKPTEIVNPVEIANSTEKSAEPTVVKRPKGRPRKIKPPEETPEPQVAQTPEVSQVTELYKMKLNNPTPEVPKYENHVAEVKLTANVPARHLRVVLRKTEIDTKIDSKFLKMQNDIERDLPIRKRSKLRYEAQL